MAIGQPDFEVMTEGGRHPSDPGPELRSGQSGERLSSQALPPHESYPERLIREAIEAGEFDDVAGTGRPIPGRGTRDDDLWWVRRWVSRNRAEDQKPTNSE